MLLTDPVKMIQFVVNDRGFKSVSEAARTAGMSRQNLDAMMKTRSMINKSYIDAFERLGYDIKFDLVRRLSDEEYKNSRSDANRIFNMISTQDEFDIPQPTVRYEIRRTTATISYPKLNDRFNQITGKYLFGRMTEEDWNTFQTVASFDSFREAQIEGMKLRKTCVTTQDFVPNVKCDITFDVLITVKVTDEFWIGDKKVSDKQEKILTHFVKYLSPYERREYYNLHYGKKDEQK